MSRLTRWFMGLFRDSKPPEPVSPSMDGCIFARFGEQITCENGHPIATFTKAVRYGDMQDVNTLYFNGETPKPVLGTEAAKCVCYLCGAPYFAGNGHFHFKDGWR